MSKSKPTVQEKMKQLDEIVGWFDGDEFQLEQASEKLKLAAALAAEIEHDLESIANDIQIVKESFQNKS